MTDFQGDGGALRPPSRTPEEWEKAVFRIAHPGHPATRFFQAASDVRWYDLSTPSQPLLWGVARRI